MRLSHSLVFTILCFSSFAQAQKITLSVLGISGRVILENYVPPSAGESLGQVSHTILEQALIQKKIQEYQGSENGITSINHMGSELEVLSDTEMNAYGWCFRVDGIEPNLMADAYILTGKEKKIEWFYAYAHLEKDDWTAMCIPADHRPTTRIIDRSPFHTKHLFRLFNTH